MVSGGYLIVLTYVTNENIGVLASSDASAKEYFFPREGDLVCFPSW